MRCEPINSVIGIIESVKQDAMNRFNGEEHHFQLYSWPQLWGDGGCGFAGMATNSIEIRQTIVILDNRSRAHYVYHNARYAYTVKKGNEKFREAMGRFRLVGQVEYNNNPKLYERE